MRLEVLGCDLPGEGAAPPPLGGALSHHPSNIFLSFVHHLSIVSNHFSIITVISLSSPHHLSVISPSLLCRLSILSSSSLHHLYITQPSPPSISVPAELPCTRFSILHEKSAAHVWFGP